MRNCQYFTKKNNEDRVQVCGNNRARGIAQVRERCKRGCREEAGYESVKVGGYVERMEEERVCL